MPISHQLKVIKLLNVTLLKSAMAAPRQGNLGFTREQRQDSFPGSCAYPCIGGIGKLVRVYSLPKQKDGDRGIKDSSVSGIKHIISGSTLIFSIFPDAYAQR